MILPRAALLCVCCVCASVRLSAQCPDGSPPPCRGAAATARAPNPNSIAVLYFDNLSRDSADAYIADGLTDEIIVRLQHVQRLDVKSRNEVRRFRGGGVSDSRALGRELHVAWLVSGSVRPSASRMRVSYELVRISDGRIMASDIVDTTSADQWAISNGPACGARRRAPALDHSSGEGLLETTVIPREVQARRNSPAIPLCRARTSACDRTSSHFSSGTLA